MPKIFKLQKPSQIYEANPFTSVINKTDEKKNKARKMPKYKSSLKTKQIKDNNVASTLLYAKRNKY